MSALSSLYRRPICLQSHSIQNSTFLTLTSGLFSSSERTGHILKIRVHLAGCSRWPVVSLICPIVIYQDASTGRAYSYAHVKSTAIDLGTGLKSVWGWRKGDVMAFFTPNCTDTPAITWGVLWAGGVVSPANPGYTAEELAFQLKDSRAKALVTQTPFLKTAVKAAMQAGIPEDRIILMGDDKDESMRFKHFSSIRNLASTSRYRRTKAHPRNDLAFLVYSSGTTGYPKGVMLCHENIVTNILMLKAGEGENLTWNGGPDGNGDSILAFLPFFHIYGRRCIQIYKNPSKTSAGLNCLMCQSLYSGLRLVVMPKFDLENFCTTIQNNKITYAYVVPPVVLLLAKHPMIDKFDLSSLRMLNSGAAPLTRELVEAVYERLKVPIKQGYGLSETSPTTHTQVRNARNHLQQIQQSLHIRPSPGNSGTKPSAPSAHSSPTKPPNTCPPQVTNSPSAQAANYGSKVPTSSKATSTIPQGQKTP